MSPVLPPSAIPSGGGGACGCEMPRPRSPRALSRRLLTARPTPPCRSARTAVRSFVGACLSLRSLDSGLLACRGWACRPRSGLAVCRGLRGACRPRLWLAVCLGLRWACRFSMGRITLNVRFRIIRLFPSSVAGSLRRSHGELLRSFES